ncbi:fasciclin domain-containing protein [Pedobacter miscanthi]|nr:fasciclin domain-containing protein [Pedobacter miscanthi]
MNKLITTFKKILLGMIVLLALSCKKEEAPINLTLETNGNTIMVYLSGKPSYSILTEALEITKLSQTLRIYGTMTLFAPTNEAFEKYFKRKGIANISEVNPDTLRNLLKYHIYNEKYMSSLFVQGSLPTVTVNGAFIKFDISKGLRQTILNGTAKIVTLDIPAANGVLHAIDDVLEPSPLTMYDWLRTQPDYSIMLEAFEKTGNAALLLKNVEYDPNTIVYGKPAIKWRTIFLEPDAVLKKENITSFEALAARFSQNYNTTKNYADPTDSLNVFVRYHTLEQKYFISDFTDTYLESASKNNFLVFSTTGGLSVNKHIVESLSGTDTVRTEVKVGVNLDRSNIITKNGIINSVNALIQTYTVKPVAVKVLFAGLPSERGLKLPNGTVSTFIAQFPLMGNNPEAQKIIPWLKWGYSTGFVPTAPTNSAFAGDNVVLLSSGTAGYWYELTTKLVFKGEYDIYVNYVGLRRGSAVTNAIFTWDGQQLGDITNLADAKDAFGNVVAGGIDNIYRRKLGTVVLPINSTHVMRIDGIANNVTSWYSMELVPVRN